jgi:hypothetical protein
MSTHLLVIILEANIELYPIDAVDDLNHCAIIFTSSMQRIHNVIHKSFSSILRRVLYTNPSWSTYCSW